MRDALLRRLAAYERLRNELKDGNPLRLLIDDAMDSLRRELVQHDARSVQEMVQKLRRRGRPPQKPRNEAG
jgi:hypothetical protein